VDGDGSKDVHEMTRIRERCEGEFSWIQDGVVTRIEGVMKVRDTSGHGVWQFLDMRHSGTSIDGPMCTMHTHTAGYPVYHGSSICPGTIEVESDDREQPSILRFAESGAQRPPKKKRGAKRKTDEAGITVNDLQKLCGLLNLPTSGTKAALHARIKKQAAAQNLPEVPLHDCDDDDACVEVREDASEEEEEGDCGEEEEEEAERVYAVVKIDGFRVVGGQEQHHIFWDDDGSTWETCDSAHAAWDIKPPYETEEQLLPLFEANKKKHAKKVKKKRR
jgi:hypothetical protein